MGIAISGGANEDRPANLDHLSCRACRSPCARVRLDQTRIGAGKVFHAGELVPDSEEQTGDDSDDSNIQLDPNLALAVQSPGMQRTRSHSWTTDPVLVALPDAGQVAVDLRLHNIFRASHRIP